MRILHFHPDGNKTIAEYVALLCRVMGEYAEVAAANDIKSLTRQIKQKRPDIIHLHGCWTMQNAIAAMIAKRKLIRTVITPHGQLEPWIIRQHYIRKKLPRILLYQKTIVNRAYSVIVMGKMEEFHLKQLKWNPRIETAYNSIITDTITEEDMCRTIYGIYDKVMNTDILKLMNRETINATSALIKAGLTGNHLWLNDHEYGLFRTPNNIEWDKLTAYVHQEGISDVVTKGIDVLGLPQPDTAPTEKPFYHPKNLISPEPLSASISIKKDKGNSKDNKETACGNIFSYTDTLYFTEMMRNVRKLTSRRRLTLSHIVETADTLRTRAIDEGKAAEILRGKRLYKFTGRIMQLLADMTGLEEGFMPVPPINDRQTNRIKTIINKHLEI